MQKKQLFLWVPYKDEYNEQLAEMFAESMLSNNPYVKILNVTREELHQDFFQQLEARKYRDVLVFVVKELFEKGIVEIAACSCCADVVDFKAKGEYAKLDNYNTVPKNSLFRAFMTFKIMQKYFIEYPHERGEFGYGSTFMVKPQYQRTGVTDLMLQATLTTFWNQGYKECGGHSLNDMAKGVYKRAFVIYDLIVSIDDMYVEESQSYPLQGMGLTQQLLKCDIKKSFDQWESKKILQMENPCKSLRPRL